MKCHTAQASLDGLFTQRPDASVVLQFVFNQSSSCVADLWCVYMSKDLCCEAII